MQQIFQRGTPQSKNALSPSSTGRSKEPAMFRGLRIRLTIWYSAVLAVALVLFGVALYIGLQTLLFSSVRDDLAMRANGRIKQLGDGTSHACVPPGFNTQGDPHPGPNQPFMSEFVACYDQKGVLLAVPHSDLLPNTFVSDTLAKRAIQEGQPVTDIVDVGGEIGPVYRYAVALHTPQSGVSVIQVGVPVKVQMTAMTLLLILLLTFGGLALLGAGIGGLFLANRALEPTRLAWDNQQRFIADASHELRTPLTLLQADAEVLLRNRENLSDEDAVLLENIVTESNHMARLSNSMLMLARLDHGSPHQEHDIVNLAEVAAAGVQRVRPLADKMGISVELEASGDPVVIGDRVMLDQAALALLDNAIKYNHRDGEVHVRTMIQQDKAILEVFDTGVGIAPEHLPRLGDRFYRVDKARSRKAGGAGLGLSIVQGIADSHHGSLTLTSTPNQGTTATLTLPLADGVSRKETM